MLKLCGKWKSNCFKDKKLRGKSEERPQDPEWKEEKEREKARKKPRDMHADTVNETIKKSDAGYSCKVLQNMKRKAHNY